PLSIRTIADLLHGVDAHFDFVPPGSLPRCSGAGGAAATGWGCSAALTCASQHAVQTIQVAVAQFQNQLSDQQRARFDALHMARAWLRAASVIDDTLPRKFIRSSFSPHGRGGPAKLCVGGCCGTVGILHTRFWKLAATRK